MAYKYITNRDSHNYTPLNEVQRVYGMSRKIEGITIHHWGDPKNNPQFENVVNYLCRPNGNTSAHYVATGTGRQVACIVSPDHAAWHAGHAWGNARTIGIELDPRARDEDYDVAAELVADIRSAYGDVPIYWHSYFVATACPGAWDPERLDKLSYTKYSHDVHWGKGGNKVDLEKPAPKPVPAPTPVPKTTPKPTTAPVNDKPSITEITKPPVNADKNVAIKKPDVNETPDTVQEAPQDEKRNLDIKTKKKPSLEASKLIGRKGILAAASAIIVALGDFAISQLLSTSIPETLVVPLGGLVFALLAWVDKYLHERAKLVETKVKGLIGF